MEGVFSEGQAPPMRMARPFGPPIRGDRRLPEPAFADWGVGLRIFPPSRDDLQTERNAPHPSPGPDVVRYDLRRPKAGGDCPLAPSRFSTGSGNARGVRRERIERRHRHYLRCAEIGQWPAIRRDWRPSVSRRNEMVRAAGRIREHVSPSRKCPRTKVNCMSSPTGRGNDIYRGLRQPRPSFGFF